MPKHPCKASRKRGYIKSAQAYIRQTDESPDRILTPNQTRNAFHRGYLYGEGTSATFKSRINRMSKKLDRAK